MRDLIGDPWWLLQPSTVLAGLLLLALASLLVRRRAPAALGLALALVLLLAPAFLPVVEWVAGPLERRVPPPERLPASVDGVIVLGGAVDWRVADARGRLAVNGAGERLLAAHALAERYPDATLVLTGLFQEMVPHDFRARPDARSLIAGPEFAGREIVFLGAARSTYEEALLALERLEPRRGETWILVTSAMHMPRAWETFRTLGWSLTPYPVDFRTRGRPEWRPSLNVAGSLAELDRAVREWGALFVYERSGRISRSER